MGMTRTIGIKVPAGQEGLQRRLSDCARRGGVECWKLLAQMLDAWERQHDAPAEDESWRQWKETVEARFEAISQSIVKQVKPEEPSKEEDAMELVKPEEPSIIDRREKKEKKKPVKSKVEPAKPKELDQPATSKRKLGRQRKTSSATV